MCTAHGADALAQRARDGASLMGERCRVLRGGCYGLCELGPNVVVRPRGNDDATELDVDRLSLTRQAGETVYSGVTPPDVDRILAAHGRGGPPVAELTLEAREARIPPGSEVAEKIRALRRRRTPPRESKE